MQIKGTSQTTLDCVGYPLIDEPAIDHSLVDDETAGEEDITKAEDMLSQKVLDKILIKLVQVILRSRSHFRPSIGEGGERYRIVWHMRADYSPPTCKAREAALRALDPAKTKGRGR